MSNKSDKGLKVLEKNKALEKENQSVENKTEEKSVQDKKLENMEKKFEDTEYYNFDDLINDYKIKNKRHRRFIKKTVISIGRVRYSIHPDDQKNDKLKPKDKRTILECTFEDFKKALEKLEKV